MLRTALIAAVLGLTMPTFGQAQEIVLRFWDNQQTESGLSQYQQEAVRSFEAENPNIKVEVTTVPYPEYQQRLLTAVQGGNAPDVSTIDQIWVAAFAAAGVIEPLDELAASAKISADTFSSRAPGLRRTMTADFGASRSTSTYGSSASTTRTC
jgi:ABC-type glycerol-3-phosphate transport system substrate-binding protein